MCIISHSLQVVAARGCAYVVMVHRSDAVRALSGLKDARLCGSQCKVHPVFVHTCGDFIVLRTLCSLHGPQDEESKVPHFVPSGTWRKVCHTYPGI